MSTAGPPTLVVVDDSLLLPLVSRVSWLTVAVLTSGLAVVATVVVIVTVVIGPTGWTSEAPPLSHTTGSARVQVKPLEATAETSVSPAGRSSVTVTADEVGPL